MAITDKVIDLFFERVSRWFEKAEKSRERELSGSAMLRAYYIEVCANLELLDSLEKKSLKDASVNSPSFAAIVSRLDTGIAEAILTSSEAAGEGGVYQVLKSSAAAETQKNAAYDNILEAVSFILIKIKLLRKLSELTDEEKTILHGIQLAKRIENLKKRLVSVKLTLRSLTGISGIAKDDE